MSDRVLWHQSGVNKHGEPFIQLLMDTSDAKDFVRTDKHEKPQGEQANGTEGS